MVQKEDEMALIEIELQRFLENNFQKDAEKNELQVTSIDNMLDSVTFNYGILTYHRESKTIIVPLDDGVIKYRNNQFFIGDDENCGIANIHIMLFFTNIYALFEKEERAYKIGDIIFI